VCERERGERATETAFRSKRVHSSLNKGLIITSATISAVAPEELVSVARFLMELVFGVLWDSRRERRLNFKRPARINHALPDYGGGGAECLRSEFKLDFRSRGLSAGRLLAYHHYYDYYYYYRSIDFEKYHYCIITRRVHCYEPRVRYERRPF
jgi:hypothetical protein